MMNIEIVAMYERNLNKLIEEINLFKHEENLWKTCSSIKNSCGNLALHITGGLNYLAGKNLLHTDYVRNRDEEFSKKDIQRTIIVQQLSDLILLMKQVLNNLSPEQINLPYPYFFDKEGATISYVLTQLLLHLNYHSGQVNYLRRMLEAD